MESFLVERSQSLEDSTESISNDVLNNNQRLAVDYFNSGNSLFITGPAGTGKTFLINYIKKNSRKKFATTALTGAAAFLIGGKTIHSWGGIGLGDKDVEIIIPSIRRNKTLRDRWVTSQVLIIDEISMMTADLFDKINEIAKIIRRDIRPFGGLQLLCFGDFCQLPPISKTGSDADRPFCFKAKTWDESINHTISLTKIIRQDDKKFQKCLNEIRFGICSETTVRRLTRRLVKNLSPVTSDIIPTKLYTTKRDVSNLNVSELEKLTTDMTTYNVTTEVPPIPNNPKKPAKAKIDKIVETMDRDCTYEPTLKLCIGAQVMLLVNIDTEKGLNNGSRGIVKGFAAGKPLVEFCNGIVESIGRHAWEHIEEETGLIVRRKQIPLQLAWAMTIHKSQGSTLDFVEIDIGENIFECGQTYVALSRAKTLKGLRITNFSSKKIKANPDVVAYYNRINGST